MSRLHLALDLLRAEGATSLVRRALDRVAERRDRLAYRPVPRSEARTITARSPIGTLHLLATPPSPRLGGVATQLCAQRQAAVRAGTTFGLLYPLGGRFRLELDTGRERLALDLGAAPPGDRAAAEALEPTAVVGAAREAVAICGAERLRVEGVAGWPLGALFDLARDLPTVLSLHDFSLFCPRPHLVEEPGGAFCHFSLDPERCAICLRATWPVAPAFQEARRELAGRLLAAAELISCPSETLAREHRRLFPTIDPARLRIEPPPRLERRLEHRAPPGRAVAAPTSGPVRRIAFVGTAHRFKGIDLFAEVVALAAPEHPEISWHQYGGSGGPAGRAALRRLRGLGVAVHGYYRAGTLPDLLARHRIDLALLLSTVPESYGLTLDECAAAGVPSIVFDLGAPSERAAAKNAEVVASAAGARGIVAAIERRVRPPGSP